MLSIFKSKAFAHKIYLLRLSPKFFSPNSQLTSFQQFQGNSRWKNINASIRFPSDANFFEVIIHSPFYGTSSSPEYRGDLAFTQYQIFVWYSKRFKEFK